MSNSINDIVKKLREGKILNEKENYDQKSQEELVVLAQGGDKYAMQLVIEQHKDWIQRMIARYFPMDYGSSQEDIEQIAKIGLWLAIEDYDPKSNGEFDAFAGMVVKRRLRDELQKQGAAKRALHSEQDYLDRTAASDDEGGEATLGSTVIGGKSAEDEYMNQKGLSDLYKFMEEEFSDRELKVAKMFAAGHKIPEIAEVLGLKYKSVENTLMRLRGKLNKYKSKMSESRSYRRSKKLEDSFSDDDRKMISEAIKYIEKDRDMKF